MKFKFKINYLFSFIISSVLLVLVLTSISFPKKPIQNNLDLFILKKSESNILNKVKITNTVSQNLNSKIVASELYVNQSFIDNNSNFRIFFELTKNQRNEQNYLVELFKTDIENQYYGTSESYLISHPGSFLLQENDNVTIEFYIMVWKQDQYSKVDDSFRTFDYVVRTGNVGGDILENNENKTEETGFKYENLIYTFVSTILIGLVILMFIIYTKEKKIRRKREEFGLNE